MLNSDLYKRNNQIQRLMNKQIIDEFSPKFKWRPNGHDSLLDIGCGPGDVTADLILPMLPQEFSRLVCSDISEQMVSVARKTVQSPKAAFEVLDIGCPMDESVWTTPFDHITSFFCLHWVHDQRQALLNIYNLLNPGGDCLLVYVGSANGYTIFTELAKRPRWAPYLQDVHKHIPPFQFSCNAAQDLENILRDVGFSEYEVRLRNEYCEFDGIDHVKAFYRAIAPFINRLSPKEKDDFMDEFGEEWIKKQSTEYDESSILLGPYKLLVVFARK